MAKENFELVIEDKKCRLSSPNAAALGFALMKIHENDIVGAGKIILNSCWIDGDEEIKDDQDVNNASLHVSACIQAMELVSIKEATLKKL